MVSTHQPDAGAGHDRAHDFALPRSAAGLSFAPRLAFQSTLSHAIHEGDLRVRLPGGGVLTAGDGTGPGITIAITDTRWLARIASHPQLALGEAYMEGALTLEEGDLFQFVDLIGRNASHRRPRRAGPIARTLKDARAQANDHVASRRNVAHHYDLSADLYRRFLDADMQYSCAYFARPEMTLEEAQLEKKRRLAAKLLLAPGQKVLDIGCGWGGMALTLAKEFGAQVDGITLSTEQHRIACQRASGQGLEKQVQFSLVDYRHVSGPYDRIVSVGMFEHVGRPNFRTYFEQVSRLLTDDGVAVIHTIGRTDAPSFTQPWIAKYIFPGGYIPALSEMMAAAEQTDLIVTDVEVLRLHYAETLRHWRERFMENRTEIARLYDERFCRMWEFYLVLSENAFRRLGHVVFQIQFAKKIGTVPLTRGYMG